MKKKNLPFYGKLNIMILNYENLAKIIPIIKLELFGNQYSNFNKIKTIFIF